MIRHKHVFMWIAGALVCVTLTTAGCMNKSNNQVKQQGVQTQQVQTQQVQNQQAQSQPQTTMGNSIQIANQAAAAIVHLPGVKQANVLVSTRNAYVAAVIDVNQGQITPELENQIAQRVRATDPNIQNVYVSTNPEFVDRINRYVTDVREGRPISGFVQEFTEIVRRVFPKAR